MQQHTEPVIKTRAERPGRSLGTVDVDGKTWEVIQHAPAQYTIRTSNISVGMSESQAVRVFQRVGFLTVRGRRPPWPGPSAFVTRTDRKVVHVPLQALVDVVAAMFRSAPPPAAPEPATADPR